MSQVNTAVLRWIEAAIERNNETDVLKEILREAAPYQDSPSEHCALEVAAWSKIERICEMLERDEI